ncbi:MAG: molybdate ABC transporter substrate-binding protein [Yoonia sp.]
MKLILSFCALFAAPVAADPIVVFAAASLKGPLDQIAGDIVVSYGGSGALARQIKQGAPADVVLLANDAWMQDLIDAKAVTDVADFASNSLVVIGPADAPDVALDDLPNALGNGKLAMGFTQAVPAGIYGRAALENLDLWVAVAPNVVELDNVRAALTLVARGEAAFGITYATDALITDAVRIVARLDPADHPPIRYRGGLVSDDPDAAVFWDTLRGQAGQAAFSTAGFIAP